MRLAARLCSGTMFNRWQVELFVGSGGVPSEMALSVMQSDTGSMFLAIASPQSSTFSDDDFSAEHFLSIGVRLTFSFEEVCRSPVVTTHS
jgi:hypothetical protein